jgi:hypothetical protein
MLHDISDSEIFAEAGRRMGLPYSLDSYYLPLVSPADLAPLSIDKTPIFDAEARFNIPAIEQFAREISADYAAPALGHDEAKELGLGLGYGYVEAELYHSIVRSQKPPLIVEVGAGVSTWFARNAAPADTRIVCIEPYPAPAFVEWCAGNNVELLKLPLQEAVSLIDFSQPCLLFIDSTHVAKITSELHMVFIDLLPRLQAGSLVHFHDIFAPFPCVHKEHNGFAMTLNWYESTLLSVYLCANEEYEVVLPQYWLDRHLNLQYLLEIASPLYAKTHWNGSAFWMRKRGIKNGYSKAG